MTGPTAASGPVLILYIFVQRYVIEGCRPQRHQKVDPVPRGLRPCLLEDSWPQRSLWLS
jgi:hypothetical protein